MRKVIYDATRNLITGRTLGDEVTLDFTNMIESQTESPRLQRRLSPSISNVMQVTFENYTKVYRYRTKPLDQTDTMGLLIREFLNSVVDQVFSFAPGSEYDGNASPSLTYACVLDGPWQERRQRSVSGDRFQYTFSLRQVANTVS